MKSLISLQRIFFVALKNRIGDYSMKMIEQPA